jgi:hypothetical protein
VTTYQICSTLAHLYEEQIGDVRDLIHAERRRALPTVHESIRKHLTERRIPHLRWALAHRAGEIETLTQTLIAATA